MRIELQLALDTALDLHRVAGRDPASHRTSPAAPLRAAVEALGLSLHPVHPGASHPLLAPFFYIDLPGAASAEAVIERLQKTTGVEAAYLRPAAEPP
jgi:hypothetical protein